MDVGTLRTFVRDHLEMDEEELPDTLLNPYLQDAFERTTALDNRWPRNETVWVMSKVVGAASAALTDDVLVPSIMSVTPVGSNQRLSYMTYANAQDRFPLAAPGGMPLYWSVWGRELFFWPDPGAENAFDVTVRGYRQPVWSAAASTIPDIDERLHPAIAYYAMSLIYAAQEDEILEGVYMSRWDRDTRGFMAAILDPPRHRPLVMNGGPGAVGGATYVIVPPAEVTP